MRWGSRSGTNLRSIHLKRIPRLMTSSCLLGSRRRALGIQDRNDLTQLKRKRNRTSLGGGLTRQRLRFWSNLDEFTL